MKLPNPGQIPRLGPRGASDPALDAMGKLVLSWVDGKATVAEIGEMCGMGGDMAAKIVADLARRGVLEVDGLGSGSDPAPTGLEAEVDRVYVSMEAGNFYDLLGVDPDADRKQLRAAYFDLSKKFHPDRAFGKNVAGMRRKMEVIFRRMTQAYDVLSSTKQRKEYDAYIADQLEVWKIEKQLKDALTLEKGLAQADGGQPGARSSAPPQPTSRPPGRAATRRSNGPARQSAASAGATVSRPSIPARDPAHDARRRQWKRQRASRALKNTLQQARSSRQMPMVNIAEYIERAAIAVEQEQHSEAIRLLDQVLKEDPKNERARKLLAQANVGATKSLVQSRIRQGMYERRQGDGERARRNFEKALEVDATNLDARYQLADLLLELRAELPRALSLCKEVIGMGGQRARYFATLGELLLLAKQPARASEAFRKALDLEPDNREYRKRLKACKI